MSPKKDDLPAMPFYVGDWLKAPDIQCLSYDLKGLWFEMLCYMWESKERGVLLYSFEELSRLLRLPEDLLKQKLKQIESKGIYSVRYNDGAIYCRRMVRDQEIREIRTIAGQKGGRRSFASRFAQANNQAKCVNENVIEIVTGTKAIKTPKKQPHTINKGFRKPTIEEVRAYCLEINSPVDPDYFFNNYESQGWIKANGMPVLNWKSTIRTWEKRDQKKVELLTDTQKRNIANFNDWEKRQEVLDGQKTV